MDNKQATLSDIVKMIESESVQKTLVKTYCEVVNAKEVVKGLSISYYFVKNGKDMVARKCSNCGHITVSDGKHDAPYRCEKCGINLTDITYDMTTQLLIRDGHLVKSFYEKGRAICKKIDNVFFLFTCTLNACIRDEYKEVAFVEGEENKWMTENMGMRVILDFPIAIFTKKHGFRQFEKQPGCIGGIKEVKNARFWRMLNIIGEDSEEIFEYLSSECGADRDYLKLITVSEIAEQYRHCLNCKKENKEKEHVAVSENLAPISKEKLLDRLSSHMSMYNFPCMQIERNGSKSVFMYGCLCGGKNAKYFTAEEKDNIYCPWCGLPKHGHIYNKNFSRTRAYVWERLNECVVCRIYCIGWSMDENEVSAMERGRIFLHPKNINTFVMKNDGCWEECKLSDILDTYRYNFGFEESENVCYNSDEELSDIINNSFLKTTGVEQAWGLGAFSEYRSERKGILTGNGYLLSYYKHRYLEHLIKSKLLCATNQAMKGTMVPNKKGKNVYEVLEISKGELKVCRELDLGLVEINFFKKLCRLQESIQKDLFLRIWDVMQGNEVLFSSFLEVCEKHNIKPKRLMDYLESCFQYQCIYHADALTIFDDYLVMATQMDYNLEEKNIKFPSSLKKEHDKAVFAYKVVEDEMKRKKFMESVEKNRVHEYRNEVFSVIVPQTPEDVIGEGQALGHCVATYVSKIADEKTTVFFIRKNNEKDVSYFTCEVRDNCIIQVKGRQNRRPDVYEDKELIQFIKEWAQERKWKIVGF